jgi:hypothetical protein
MADTETSTPDIQTQVIILSIVRAVLLILGTFGVTWAQTVSGSVIEQAAGAGAILVGIAWSCTKSFNKHVWIMPETSPRPARLRQSKSFPKMEYRQYETFSHPHPRYRHQRL